VRRLVAASVSSTREGVYPRVFEGEEKMKPEDLAGWEEEYARIAPEPENWPALIEKIIRMDREFRDWPVEMIRSVTAPTLVIVGDSDIVRPDRAVEMFRLFGGGVAGDIAGLPRSQLAVLPGTTHAALVDRADWPVSMITVVLDTPG
jgi:pimeloyl-ACP methyl ester carboxylesterase